MKPLMRDNVTIPNLMDNGVEVTVDLNKAEVLNSQFKSAFTRKPVTSALPNKGHSPHPDMSTNEEGVFQPFIYIKYSQGMWT